MVTGTRGRGTNKSPDFAAAATLVLGEDMMETSGSAQSQGPRLVEGISWAGRRDGTDESGNIDGPTRENDSQRDDDQDDTLDCDGERCRTQRVKDKESNGRGYDEREVKSDGQLLTLWLSIVRWTPEQRTRGGEGDRRTFAKG